MLNITEKFVVSGYKSKEDIHFLATLPVEEMMQKIKELKLYFIHELILNNYIYTKKYSKLYEKLGYLNSLMMFLSLVEQGFGEMNDITLMEQKFKEVELKEYGCRVETLWPKFEHYDLYFYLDKNFHGHCFNEYIAQGITTKEQLEDSKFLEKKTQIRKKK